MELIQTLLLSIAALVVWIGAGSLPENQRRLEGRICDKRQPDLAPDRAAPPEGLVASGGFFNFRGSIDISTGREVAGKRNRHFVFTNEGAEDA